MTALQQPANSTASAHTRTESLQVKDCNSPLGRDRM